jgi:hypothetical protein
VPGCVVRADGGRRLHQLGAVGWSRAGDHLHNQRLLKACHPHRKLRQIAYRHAPRSDCYDRCRPPCGTSPGDTGAGCTGASCTRHSPPAVSVEEHIDPRPCGGLGVLRRVCRDDVVGLRELGIPRQSSGIEDRQVGARPLIHRLRLSVGAARATDPSSVSVVALMPSSLSFGRDPGGTPSVVAPEGPKSPSEQTRYGNGPGRFAPIRRNHPAQRRRSVGLSLGVTRDRRPPT